jgi:SAM-dependent methyltransferase
MTPSPSRNHPNRKAYNWLAYWLLDRHLCQSRGYIRGDVLDAGCGSGPYRSFVLSCAETYTGVDWGGTQHRSRPDIVADLNTGLPCSTSSFDTVFCISVLEHLHSPQVALSEFARVLRPGGQLVLQVPWQWGLHEVPHDYFRFTPYALQKLLERSGFGEIVIESQGGCFSVLCLKVNYLSLRLVRGPLPLRAIAEALLSPAWWLGQTLAPIFDRLDRNWAAETGGYFVRASRLASPSALN